VPATRASIDFASATDSSLDGAQDPAVLEQTAHEGRIRVTHDRRTMSGHFRARLESGRHSPGVLIVPQFAPIGPVVEAIILIWAASEPGEWRDQIHHLPTLVRHVFGR